jgi:putative membrane protein
VRAALAAAPAPAVTDADIAAIVLAADSIDVRLGELALSKSSNAEVRKFAQQMVTEHNAVNEAAVALVTKLGVTRTPNATSRGLEASSEQTHGRLSALEGAAFDRAYIAHEVAHHTATAKGKGLD